MPSDYIMSEYIAIVSDMHAGSIWGLLNPNTIIADFDSDGKLTHYKPNLTASQKFLWYETYLPGIEFIRKKANGKPITLFELGDLTHGKSFNSELVSSRIANQETIAYYNMLPWQNVPNLKAIRMVIGTGVHNNGEGSMEAAVYERLQSIFPDISLLIHGLKTINKTTIDYAHHGPISGTRTWLRGNVLRYYAQSIMLDEILNKRNPPHIILRGHTHDYVHEVVSLNGFTTHAFICPPLCFIDEHAKKVTKSKYILTVGMLLLEVSNGNILDIIPLTRKLDLRTKE